MKVVVKHTGMHADAESNLERAAEAVKHQREQNGKVLSDDFLKNRKDQTDLIIKRIFNNMIEEIADVVVGK